MNVPRALVALVLVMLALIAGGVAYLIIDDPQGDAIERAEDRLDDLPTCAELAQQIREGATPDDTRCRDTGP